mmetsp:Transcript_65097/g.153742  ORF Transcript_65097/g.153742 Transcript_65097/m.153742 type:complete len:233 (+) Transcript_65097:503-1201(+)
MKRCRTTLFASLARLCQGRLLNLGGRLLVEHVTSGLPSVVTRLATGEEVESRLLVRACNQGRVRVSVSHLPNGFGSARVQRQRQEALCVLELAHQSDDAICMQVDDFDSQERRVHEDVPALVKDGVHGHAVGGHVLLHRQPPPKVDLVQVVQRRPARLQLPRHFHRLVVDAKQLAGRKPEHPHLVIGCHGGPELTVVAESEGQRNCFALCKLVERCLALEPELDVVRLLARL